MSIYTKVELPFYWKEETGKFLKMTSNNMPEPFLASTYSYGNSSVSSVDNMWKVFSELGGRIELKSNKHSSQNSYAEVKCSFGKFIKIQELVINAYMMSPDSGVKLVKGNTVLQDLKSSGTYQFDDLEIDSLCFYCRSTVSGEYNYIFMDSIQITKWKEKIEITEEYTLNEVSKDSTDECIFYKKVNVTRHNDWVYYDFPKNIIPVAVRINGELTYFDWDGAGQAAASFDYESSGRKEVINKTFGIAQGKTQAFDYTIDNLNETYNETASKIGHKFNSRTNGNTCYIRVYKWLEKKTIDSTVKATGGYLNTKDGPKRIKAVIVNTEGGPKAVFGSLT